MKENTKGTLAIILAAVIWGFIGITIRWFTSQGIKIIPFLFYTSVFSIILVYLIGRKQIDFKPKWKNFKFFLLLGIIGLITGFCFFYAFIYTKIAFVELLHNTMPVWAFLLAMFWLKEKISKWRLLALIMAIIGIILIFDIKNLFELNLTNLGNLLALISAFSYAGSVAVARRLKRVNQFTTTFWVGVIYTIGIIPFFIAYFQKLNLWQIFILVVYAMFVPVIGLLLYYYGLRKIEVSRASILLLIELVIAAITAWIFLGESLGIIEIIGGLFIITSTVILIKRHKNTALKKELR